MVLAMMMMMMMMMMMVGERVWERVPGLWTIHDRFQRILAPLYVDITP